MTCIKKLIATDMDGTFLDSKGSYDRERFARVLTRLKEKGIRFVVASGRSYLGVQSLFADTQEDIIFIAENGSLVMEKGQAHVEAVMDQETYLSILTAAQTGPFSEKGQWLLSGRRAGYVLSDTDASFIDKMTEYYGKVEVVERWEDVTDEVFKLTAILDEDFLLEVADWLNQVADGVTAMVTGFRSIDIVREDVDKRTGLEQLCQDLGIRPEEVVVFGDNFNDYQMMEFAGTAIAPSNARPEIQALADRVIGDHDSGAVLDYIEELLDEH